MLRNVVFTKKCRFHENYSGIKSFEKLKKIMIFRADLVVTKKKVPLIDGILSELTMVLQAFKVWFPPENQHLAKLKQGIESSEELVANVLFG